jgi:Kef-type K+ transport system membrane component KefB
MSPFLQLAFVLSIILLAAKAAGYLSTRLGQPSVLGELLVGLLLGPSLLDLTHLYIITDTHLTEIVIELGELGVLILMFLAGLELHFSELIRNVRVSVFSGFLGVVTPVGLGWLLGILFGLDGQQAFFLGLSLGATSVSISAQTLMELKMLRSRVGLGLLGAAVLDDILVILLLSTFLALITSTTGGLVSILIVFGRMLLFLLLSAAFGLWVLPYLTRKINELSISYGLTTLALVVMLVYGLAAELIGEMAAITGTFLAGLMLARTPEKLQFEDNLQAVAYSFFVPIFFVTIGLSIDLHTLEISALWISLAVSVIAILGKLLGAGLGARLASFSWRESIQLGIGMVSRGEVGLIVAKVGLDAGLLNSVAFSAVIAMVLITTLVTPPLLRTAFKQPAVKPVVIAET